MSKAAQRTTAFVEDLSPHVLDITESVAKQFDRFYDSMAPEQRVELAQSRVEADAGQVIGQEEIDRELDALFAAKA